MKHTPPAPPVVDGPEQIMELANAFQKSRILLTAFELGVFTALGEDTLDAATVAGQVGADPRAVDRLLCALVSLGFVRKEEGKYRNRETARRFLVQGSPLYLSNLSHTANLYQRWGSLTEAVKSGGTVLPHFESPDFEFESFIEAMHRRALRTADEIPALLDLTRVERVLDVGGGSGVYAMAFCKAKPGITAEVLDLPKVTPLTRKYVAAAHMEHCVTAREGDYMEADFGSGFDLVFFSAVVHINSPEENELLMRKAFTALNPGGKVVVQDFVMSEDRLTPPFGTVFAMNMIVNTKHGDTYTESEIRGWLENTGFKRIERRESGPTTAMMIGRKPA